MTFSGQAKQAGLGESGEAYIVSNELTMLNDSRFLGSIDQPAVQALQTTIGIQHVDTEAVLLGLKGESAAKIIKDYRGIDVLSAYIPYQLFGEACVILAEIDKQEVLEQIDATIRELITIIAIALAIIISLILLFFKQLIIQPIHNLNIALKSELFSQEQQIVVSQSLLNEYKRAVDLSTIVSKADIAGNITYVNQAFCDISGYSQEELLGNNHNIIRSHKTPGSVFKDLWKTISAKKTWKGIICNHRKNGGDYYVSSTIVPLLNIDGSINEYISIRTDVTELFHQQLEIQMHTTDALTSLPNRQKFLEVLTHCHAPLIAIINIDRFSEVNDYYGHEIGDQVLLKFSDILKGQVNENVTVYRLSGDEFALLAKDDYSDKDFEILCQSILAYLEDQTLSINDNELNIAASIGIAGNSNNTYLNAGMALRVAQESHQPMVFYNSNVDLQKRNEENLVWTKKIKQAITEDRIALFIQPIVNGQTGNTNKYECLMRFIETDGKEISPFFFLEIAKHARLYSQLTEIIINKSFDYFSNKTESFSINLTIEDILNKNTIKLLREKLHHQSIAKRVVLEIVESEGIENFDDVSAFIQEMKYLGCAIAIDDFGTGYSNFEYLMKLDPDFIKIDGSIIKNILHDEGTLRITELINDFAKNINTKTIAEFVCDEKISEKVQEIGIDYMQGYHFGKPKRAV